MTNKIIYDVEVTGAESATAKVNEFENTLAKKSSKVAGDLSGIFTGLSRDIDVIGGQMTASAAKGIGDVLGIAEALGSGGVLGPIAIVTTAVGGVVALVTKWRDEEEEVRKKAEELRKAHDAALKSATEWSSKFAEATLAGKAAVTDQEIATRNATIVARGLAEAQLILEVAEARIVKARARGHDDFIAAIAGEREAAGRLAEFRATTSAMVVERDKRLNKQVADEARAARQDDAREHNKALDDKAKKRQEDAQARIREEKELAAALESSRAASEKSASDHAKLVADDQREAAEERARWDRSIAALDALQMEDQVAATKNREDAERKASEQLATRTEREKELARAIEERARAQLSANAETQIGTSVNMAYGASTMVLNAMMQPLIGTLQAYGSINRENWRDLLQFTDDSRAAFAAQVQTAMWSLSMQSGQKSIFEIGEQYREQALAIGSAATGNFVGASVHMMSAAQHGVASTVYAGIAGTSAGASLGVGAMRGDGGLFGLTKEERERQERNRSGGDSLSNGPAMEGPRVGTSRGGGGGPVVVNFVYESGAINAQDRDAAAATVARASSTVRRDGFMRRRANG